MLSTCRADAYISIEEIGGTKQVLVYANSFTLKPMDGPVAVIRQIAAWVGRPRNTFIDPERVALGIGELRFADGSSFKSVVTRGEEGSSTYPYLFCATLMHGQDGVPGRRWVVEIGIKQPSPESALSCSVLMRTDEISSRVKTPVQVTRPGIVHSLISNCEPLSSTPSIAVIPLTEDNAPAFAYEIEREGRQHPIVIVSSDRNGVSAVGTERLRSVLVGLAQVMSVDKAVDTFALEGILGRRYSAFGGAINVIFPYQRTVSGGFCKTLLLRPDFLAGLTEEGSSPETEILGIVTHRTNLPHSWRHTSPEDVSQAILVSRLTSAARGASGGAEAQDTAAYEELLQDAADRITAKDVELTSLRTEFSAVEAQADQLRAEIDGLKHALNGTQSRTDVGAGQIEDALAPLREVVAAVLSGSPTLEQALRLFGALYSERVIVLDTAIGSAVDSDRAGFQYGGKAFELLTKLAGGYWDALSAGNGDHAARTVFGKNAYSAKEAESLSTEGRRRRTFTYLDKDVLMERHLKHGVKDSSAETLRIHFEWFADKKLIVIGHCGKHLDF